MSLQAAGARDRKIVLLRGIARRDHGDVKTEWYEQGEDWASFKVLSGDERSVNANNLAQLSVEFELLYSSNSSWLSAADAIKYDGKIYDIQSVAEVGNKDGLKITAKARDAING